MKLLDPLGGLLTSSGSAIVHFLYLTTYGVLLLKSHEFADSELLPYLHRWFFIHLFVISAIRFNMIKSTYMKGIQFAVLFSAVMMYQGMVLYSAIGHIKNATDKKLHFFYVEDIVHFLVFSEIIIFFSNLIMNGLILLVASCFGVKMLRPPLNHAQNDEQ